MEIVISLSMRNSPLQEAQTVLDNSKDNLKKAVRNEQTRRSLLTKATQNESGVKTAREKLKGAQVSRKTNQDIVRMQQQRVGRAQVVDRLVTEWNRLDKLKGTDQDTEQTKTRRAELGKKIAEARVALRKIKRPKSTVQNSKKK